MLPLLLLLLMPNLLIKTVFYFVSWLQKYICCTKVSVWPWKWNYSCIKPKTMTVSHYHCCRSRNSQVVHVDNTIYFSHSCWKVSCSVTGGQSKYATNFVRHHPRRTDRCSYLDHQNWSCSFSVWSKNVQPWFQDEYSVMMALHGVPSFTHPTR